MFTLDLETNKAARYEVNGERINHGYARLLGMPQGVVHFCEASRPPLSDVTARQPS